MGPSVLRSSSRTVLIVKGFEGVSIVRLLGHSVATGGITIGGLMRWFVHRYIGTVGAGYHFAQRQLSSHLAVNGDVPNTGEHC